MSLRDNQKTGRHYEIFGVLMLALSTMLFLALITDPFQTTASAGDGRRLISDLGEVHNVLGKPGAIVATIFYIVIGHASHVIYFLTGLWGIMLLRHLPIDRLPTRIAGSLLLLGSIAIMLDVDFATGSSSSIPGGTFGSWIGSPMKDFFGVVGANVVTLTLAIIGVLLATEFLFVHLVRGTHTGFILMLGAIAELYSGLRTTLAARSEHAEEKRQERLDRAKNRAEERERKTTEKKSRSKKKSRGSKADDIVDMEMDRDLSRIRIKPEPSDSAPESPFDDIPSLEGNVTPEPEVTVASKSVEPVPTASETMRQLELPVKNDPASEKKPMPRRKLKIEEELPADYVYPKRYKKPSINIFDPAPVIEHHDLGDMLRQTSLLLEQTLETFSIEAQVTDVTRGPTITRFEIEPAPGIKVSRFLALADDLALALKAHRVRVEAPIPGKGRVGIEVPNEHREPVVIRELIESKKYKRNKGILNLALGKDIAGHVMTADLAKMPHLLVAGATGAGKTVCVKTILASLLSTKTPEEMQLMLIDPKMVELSIFNDIPHLITPVVINPKKAAASLNWLIVEMEERYRLFAHLRVRNIEIYNESVDNGEIEMENEDGEGQSLNVIRKLPYIVCVIDELADLMMLARSEVEDAIGRLAQLARAVGIHMIIATQRPSVDVLTGVIKANFPSRISFQVSSRVDSRCILDEIGAERLIGMGDMLYLPAGQSKPTRIQGAFVSDEEMNQLIAYLKTQAPPQYRDEIENFGKSGSGIDELGDESDELLDEAIKVVLDTGQASISMVQRKLRVGYTRAARLIDMMELKGVVGPHIGSKAREILVSAPPQDEVA